MDNSRVSSVIGSRNRERFRIDNVPMAGIQPYSKYTLIYTTRYLSMSLTEIEKIFSDPVFRNPKVEINPAYVKNPKDTYFAKVIFDTNVKTEQIKEAIYSYRTGSVADYNDINTPMEPKSKNLGEDGNIRYICGRCGSTYLKSPRCPECGQLVKD